MKFPRLFKKKSFPSYFNKIKFKKFLYRRKRAREGKADQVYNPVLDQMEDAREDKRSKEFQRSDPGFEIASFSDLIRLFFNLQLA